MAAINLHIRDASGRRRGQVSVDTDVYVRDIISAVPTQLGWVAAEHRSFAAGLFTRQPGRVWLYAPDWGVLDENKTLGEQNVKEDCLLCLYVSPPKSAELALSAIQLTQGETLSAVGRCVVVEWQDKAYPVILPADVAPEGDDGVLWLLDVVARQISDISNQVISRLDWTTHRCYNVQKQRWISFTDTATRLGEQISHGDRLRLVEADEILILDERTSTESQATGERRPVQADDDLLSQIRIGSEDEMRTIAAITLGNTRLELVRGDLTQQATDAIVNAARPELTGGGGVDGAIHRAAGPALAKASSALAPCPPGQAVLTPAYRLPCRWVIHAVGPVYQGGSRGEAQVLASAYRNSLQLAINSRLRSIAFPSISTGAYGYPVSQAAKVALNTVAEVIENPTGLELVRFVLFSDGDYQTYRMALDHLAADLSIPVEESSEEP